MKISVFTLIRLFFATIIIVVYLVYRSAKAADAPKEIMQRRCGIAVLLSLAATFGIMTYLLYYFPQVFEQNPSTSTVNTAPKPSTTPVQPSPEPTASQPTELPITDYAEILRNSEEYDGKEVVVAGRIAKLGYDSNKHNFYFRDRLGFLSIGKSFEVRLSQQLEHFTYGEEVSDRYVKNQYVLVQGVWSHSTRYPALLNAVVISTGEEAQRADHVFMDEWETVGQSYSKFPITDYMDLAQAPKSYLGQRVRLVGQVQAVGENAVAWDKYFSFRNQDNHKKSISFSLQGCPPEMQSACVEGEYVVISCLVAEDDYGSTWFSDCFVECVGDEAEAIFEQFYAE